MKIETKAIIITSAIFSFLGLMILVSATQAQARSWGVEGVLLFFIGSKWAIAGAFIAISYFQFKKKRIFLAIFLLPIAIFLTYGDIHDRIKREQYLKFVRASARGEIPLGPLIEKWRNDNHDNRDIRGIELGLRANVDVSVTNLKYMANRSMAEHPKHNSILQGVIIHKDTPENLIRAIYEFKKEEYGLYKEENELTKKEYAILLCLFGGNFAGTINTPTDILEEIIDTCDKRVLWKARGTLKHKNANKASQPTQKPRG